MQASITPNNTAQARGMQQQEVGQNMPGKRRVQGGGKERRNTWRGDNHKGQSTFGKVHIRSSANPHCAQLYFYHTLS